MARRGFMNRGAMGKLYFFIFLLGITVLAFGEEKEETPFQYNCRWYRNDFKWWDTWHKELYGDLGKKRTKDSYNAKHLIDSIKRLKRWVLPEKAGLFESFIEFYGTIKKEIEKGNLRKYDINRIKHSLKAKRKEFVTQFHYKNLKPGEWISKEVVDKSTFEKIETAPMFITSKEKSKHRYVAHRYGRAFHKRSCDIVKDMKESDKIYFKTKRRVLSTNRKRCRECKP